jgi:hypothetical protein
MYEQDTIMIAGGGLNAAADCDPTGLSTNRGSVINPAQTGAAWQEKATMNHPRFHFYLVALPDGKILAVGGFNERQDTTKGPCHPNHGVLPAEIYNPTTDAWADMEPMAVPREYPSTAVLLADGYVFVAGGQTVLSPDPLIIHHERTYQIFKPPYFYDPAGRPVISSAPAIIYYNLPFNLTPPDAPNVTQVRLIRLGAATHSFDQNQRMFELDFAQIASDKVCVAGPGHGDFAPPGYYVVFTVKGGTNGPVPSVARFLKLTWTEGSGE